LFRIFLNVFPSVVFHGFFWVTICFIISYYCDLIKLWRGLLNLSACTRQSCYPFNERLGFARRSAQRQGCVCYPIFTASLIVLGFWGLIGSSNLLDCTIHKTTNYNSATSVAIPFSGISFSLEFWFNAPSLSSSSIELLSVSDLVSISLTNTELSFNLDGNILNSDGFTPSANQWYRLH